MGTAVSAGEDVDGCSCACQPHLPAFREDLHICVDDLHDCPLIPFMSGTTYQKIPYVFLPLKGQIVYPSAELVFAGAESPICVVSAARYLSPAGWEDLRNRSDAEPPFRLFPDEGRTFLQWLGDSELRENLEGRLILVHLMCKDMVDEQNPTNNIFTSCLSFRVAGTPSDNSIQNGVKEVSFSVDSQLQAQNMGSSYIVIAVSSVLLGLIYISSVLFYIHGKKRKTKYPESRSGPLGVAEEGIVKNNPLLKHCHDNAAYLSDPTGSCSESDDGSELPPPSDDLMHSVQTTSVLIHPCSNEKDKKQMEPSILMQDTSNIERLPEENVSIIETLDLKEERPETVRAMTTTNGRRKLYFNPAYFEPELLLAPPPAAIEFLMKIREVISIAKAKMEAKRFLPSLMGIPEETDYSMMKGSSMAGSESTVIFRREHSNRHRFCHQKHYRHIDQNCHTCCRNSEQKQSSIQKWLENVPLAGAEDEVSTVCSSNNESPYCNQETASLRSISLKSKSDDSIYANKEVIDSCEISFQNTLSCEALRDITDVKNHEPPKTNLFKEYNNNIKNNSNNEKVTLLNSTEKLNNHQPNRTNETNISSLNSSRDNEVKSNMLNDNQDMNSMYEPIHENGMWLEDYINDENVLQANNDGFSTPSDYADNDPGIMNKINSQLSKKTAMIEKHAEENKDDDNDYETIMLSQQNTDNQSMGDFISRSSGYSLISEVYVNDGYDYISESSQSNPSSINTNISDDEVGNNRTTKGHLTIKVSDDPPENYTNESDSFEPDTLDRKPNKLKINQEITINIEKTQDIYADSLERPQQISLKSSGTFKSDACWNIQDKHVAGTRHSLNRAFGSLREIFEAKTKYNQCTHNKSIKSCSPVGSTKSLNETESYSILSWRRGKPKLLRPEAKQAKRQRPPSPPNHSILTPPETADAVELTDVNRNEEIPPLPPRVIRPPLPPKNEVIRTSINQEQFKNKQVPSTKSKHSKLETNSQKSMSSLNHGPTASQLDLFLPKEHSCHKHQSISLDFKSESETKECGQNTAYLNRQLAPVQNKTEDSGYLSTDSNASDTLLKRQDSISETDDSFFDGASESGAESIATDSFFFGKFHKSSKSCSPANSSPIYSDCLGPRN